MLNDSFEKSSFTAKAVGCLIILFVCLSGPEMALAQKKILKLQKSQRLQRKPLVRKKPKPPPAPSPWDVRFNLDWLNGVYARTPSDSVYSPGNSVFEIERAGFRSDLNMDFRFLHESQHKFVVRPRLYDELMDIEYKHKSEPYRIQRERGKVDLTEAFYESWLSDDVSATVGLQNYQWGPAEFMSPSNPIYHFQREQRSVMWKEKGRNLIRLNWSPTAALNFVLISEPVNNGEAVYIADRDFKPKALLKAEVRSEAEALNYLGLSAGSEEETKPFLGSYFNYTPTDGITVYSDFRFTQKGFVYYPTVTNGGLTVDMLEDDRYPSGAYHHLGVYGIRFEFEYWDLRLEYINNSRGLSKDEFDLTFVSAAAMNPNADQNYRRLLRPGLELIGRHYGYVSIRVPDVGPEDAWQFYLRLLGSGMDRSGLIQFSCEGTLSDNWIFIAEARHTTGPRDSEFTIQEKSMGFLGFKYLM